jgi:hypothetical protein
MISVRSPWFLALVALAACVHAPEPAPAEERPAAVRPAPPPPPPPPQPPPREPAAPPAKPHPSKTAEPAPKERTSPPAKSSSAAATTAAKPATVTPRPAAPPQAVAKAEPAPAPGGPGDYFPLAVGNEWVYVDQSPALPKNRRGVLRTVRILDRTADGFYRDNERGNLRVDGTCVRDRDRRLLCLPFTEGATWSSVLSATSTERYEIASVGQVVETPAGKFERCVRVRAHNRVKASIDQVLEITYAPKVGPVLIETYVVVDGRVTPQVRALLQSYKLVGGP